MIMRFEDVMDDDDLQLELNWKQLPLEEGEVCFKPTLFSREYWLRLLFQMDLLNQGVNHLDFMPYQRNPQVAAPLVLAELSIRIEYRNRQRARNCGREARLTARTESNDGFKWSGTVPARRLFVPGRFTPFGSIGRSSPSKGRNNAKT